MSALGHSGEGGGLLYAEALSALEGARLSVSLSDEQWARASRFFALRAQWGVTHNLSGPQALADLRTDLIDAVAVWVALEGVAPVEGGGLAPSRTWGAGAASLGSSLGASTRRAPCGWWSL